MANQYPRSRLLWSLTSSGIGTTLTESGNSGGWAGNEPGDWPPAMDAETPIDLRDIQDLALMVSVGDVTGTPALIVTLYTFDDLGNAYETALNSGTAISTAKNVLAYGGLHGGSADSYLVLPMWGQLSWAVGADSSVTGTEIALFGR